MKEAASGCTVWENVDEDTFIRFGQYVYTRNYEGSPPFVPGLLEPSTHNSNGLGESFSLPAHPAVQLDTDELDAAEPAPEDTDSCGARSITQKQDKRKKKRHSVFSDFDKKVESLASVVPSPPTWPQTMKTAWDSFQTQRSYECGVAGPHLCPINKDSQSEYRDVFLSHARVHTMAACYGIEALAQLALHKLHRILCQFTLHEDRICDVVALLRELVSAFTACHAKRLWISIEFQELFAAHGELSRAVMGNIVERMQ